MECCIYVDYPLTNYQNQFDDQKFYSEESSNGEVDNLLLRP